MDSRGIRDAVDVTVASDTPGRVVWARCRPGSNEGLLYAREVVVDQQVSKAASGVHELYGLAASQYILDVESTCEWSFRFKPRS